MKIIESSVGFEIWTLWAHTVYRTLFFQIGAHWLKCQFAFVLREHEVGLEFAACMHHPPLLIWWVSGCGVNALDMLITSVGYYHVSVCKPRLDWFNSPSLVLVHPWPAPYCRSYLWSRSRRASLKLVRSAVPKDDVIASCDISLAYPHLKYSVYVSS